MPLWTVNVAAPEFGVDRDTLSRRLRELGVQIPQGAKARKPWLTTRQVMAAVVGDLERERIRETSAKADLLEMDKAAREGRTVELLEVEQIFANRIQPVRAAIVGMPSTLAAKVNPADPAHALAVLNDWADGVLAIGRGEQSDSNAT